MTLVFQQFPRSITKLMAEAMPEDKPMTIADLMEQLEAIPDKSTPVFLESGEPVHYTSHGMNQNETRFFIGVM